MRSMPLWAMVPAWRLPSLACMLRTAFCIVLLAHLAASAAPGNSSSRGLLDDGGDHELEMIKGDKHAQLALAVELSGHNFDSQGAKWPSPAFVAAVRDAACWVDVPAGSKGASGEQGSKRRQVVIMAMANDNAMNATVPVFVQSMQQVPVACGGSLADHFLLMCSSPSAAEMCKALGLGSRCVLHASMQPSMQPPRPQQPPSTLFPNANEAGASQMKTWRSEMPRCPSTLSASTSSASQRLSTFSTPFLSALMPSSWTQT
jgi:hypothetical protein